MRISKVHNRGSLKKIKTGTKIFPTFPHGAENIYMHQSCQSCDGFGTRIWLSDKQKEVFPELPLLMTSRALVTSYFMYISSTPRAEVLSQVATNVLRNNSEKVLKRSAFTMSSLNFQLLSFVLSCYFVWTVLARVDKEIILKEPKKGQQWHWDSTAAWRATGSVYHKCTICSTFLSYIRTPFILLPPLVRTVDVTIVYRVINCSTIPNPCPASSPAQPFCSEEFDLKKFEANKPVEEVVPELFKDKVKTIKSPNPGNISKEVITVTVNNTGVYFALFDRSACQTLYSFEVSYKICSRVGANLLVFENTPVPPIGEYSNVTNGRCVKNSALAPGVTAPQAVCNSNGGWIVNYNATCFCNPGYQPNADFKLCVECPKRTFKDINRSECTGTTP